MQKIIIFHVPRHSSEECKVLIEYSKKYAAQWPHKDNEYRPGRGDKHCKYVKFDGSVRRLTSWNMVILFPRKRDKKTSQKFQE